MSQILQVHAFLGHSFSKNENLIPDSLKHDLIHQRIQIPYHYIPIHRDGMTGKVVDPDVNFKRSCATATSCGINTANTRVEPTIMKSIHEISKQALRSTKMEFNLLSCIRKSPDCSGDLPTVPSIIDELLKMASEDVVQNWCFPKGYFLRLTAQISEAGTFLLPKRETITFLKKRIRSCKPRESYATIEDTVTPLPTLTKLIHNPALHWDFELDTFQKRAILCLENNKTVFVSAHTSSGKTVIAEYACAICLRRGSRVIYTSPVKALSNQKFHDFRERFGENVGLITGDIKLAQEASLLVMTTEILYNMLCNASEIIKNLEIVILDEVHYINNPDRGYVWEQIMIMLPKHILLVMLSATVPNNYQIADWLGRVRGCEIHVIATDKRPVPLEHYLYTGMTEQYTSHLHLIVDKDGRFIDSGYQAASLSKIFGGSSYRTPVCRGKDAFIMHTKNTWLGFVNLLKEQNLMPAIAFTFSRSSAETLAKNLSSVDLTSKSEKQQITKFFSTITGRLRKCDRKLASVKFLHDLTRRGLAVHHSGMLPILKETVELLFRAGLVKILFATETVSTGVNTPARCVVFTSLEKFDGHIKRSLDPSEFTQMAGRAGRRGIDAKGLVIILVSTIGKSLKSSVTGLPTESLLRNMILGRQTELISRFRVTYSMILNLHRSSSLTPQDIMKRSFMEAASHRWETKQRQHLSVLNKKLNETTKIISHNNNTDNNISNIIIQTSTITISKSIGGTSDSFKSLIDSLDVQVKCPHNGVECCDSIGQYYQLCYKYRQLTNSIISTLDVKYAQRLQQIFCPGRLILLQLMVNQSVWLVPAVIINYHWKTKNNNAGNQIMLNVILWELPVNLPNSLTLIKKQEDGQSSSELALVVSGSDTVTSEQMNNNKNTNYYEYDEIEEEILRNSINEGRTTTIPVPPHLMPVFVPFSLCDGYSRLTRQSVPLSDSLVRICDQIVTFQDMRYNLVDNDNSKLPLSTSELLLQSIKQLINIRRKDDTKLLSVDVNDHQLDQHLQVINLALFNCVNSIVPQESALTSAVYYPTLRNTPKQMDFKMDLNLVMDDEDICLFDEYSTLNDQLTIPLANGTITAFSSTNLLKCPNLLQHLKLVHQTIRRKFAIKSIENNLANYQLQLSNEYTGRLSVLKELGFIDSATQSYCLSFKGFFACELTSKEVLLTQLLLDGFIDDLLAPDIAAVLSAFSNELRAQDLTPEKTTSYYLEELIVSINRTASTTTTSTNYTSNFNLHKDLECIPRHLLLVFKNVLTRAYELETLQRRHNLTDPYLESRLDLRIVPLVYKWANGYSFSATISKCDIPEGSLIKSLLQLDELIRHISGACRQFGNHILSLKIDEARDLIHRDIVCSPSLYVLQDIKLAKDD